MTKYLTAYVITSVTFLSIDFLWLKMMGKHFYYERLGHLMADQPNWAAALLFYIIYTSGIVIFAVSPALRADAAPMALVYGALFGFFTYATYDMTNFATLKNWSLAVTIVDIVWGSFLTATAAIVGFLGTRYLINI